MYPALFMLELYPLVLFAYFFLENPFPRESRIVAIVGGVILLATSAYTAYQIISFGPNHRTPFGLFVILASVVLLWTVLVFARKTIVASKYSGRWEPFLTRPDRIMSWSWASYILASILSGISKLTKPVGREARGYRAFFIIVLFWVIVGVVGSLSLQGGLPSELLLITSLIGMLVFISGFVLVYTNYSGEPTSFQVKLTGVSLVTMLAALGILSLRAYTVGELTSGSGIESPQGQSLSFEPGSDGTYTVLPTTSNSARSRGAEQDISLGRNSSVEVDLGFSFPFAGSTFQTAFVNENGFVSFGDSVRFDLNPMYLGNGPVYNEIFFNDIPKISPLFYDFGVKHAATVTYARLPESFTLEWTTDGSDVEAPPMSVSLSLSSTGGIRFDYGDIGVTVTNLLRGINPGRSDTPGGITSFTTVGDSSFVATAGVLVEDYRAIFKSYQHGKIANYFEIIVWTALFILVVFPMFFKANLIDPLRSLLQGVRRVNDGDLGVEVPVYLKDEIGLLASNFNLMTESLKKAHHDLEEYADQLEIKVADRTFELRSSLEELKRTQTQLIHAEKMASLGLMTSGVAHEIKNPLNFVTNFAEVNVELLEELGEALDGGTETEEIHALLTDIKNSAVEIAKHGRRADSIVKNMMQHAAASSGQRDLTDVHKLLDESIATAVHSASNNSGELTPDFERQYDDAVASIYILPQEIGRVFVNVVSNAIKATQKKLQKDSTFKPLITISTQARDGMIYFVFHDNGIGIPVDIQDKIFQPFFTTGSGTENVGLGLSLSYDIVVEGHEGSFEFESVEDEYSEFTIALPIDSDRA
jgi:signal transduction histidine kinase